VIVPSTSSKALFRLAWFAGLAYILIGVVGGLWPSHWRDASTTDQALWIILSVVGGGLLLAGSRLMPDAPRLGAVMISLGGVVGGLPVFWAILPIVVALALIFLSVRYAWQVGQPGTNDTNYARSSS
jgi:hypothetical protein